MSTNALHLGDGRTIRQNVYEHGGSRIWVETSNGNRDLVVDTYGDETLAAWMFDKACYYVEKLQP
jgi:hypothetical protein